MLPAIKLFAVERDNGLAADVVAIIELGLTRAKQTVKNGLVEPGLGPQPSDHPDPRHKLLKHHAEILWQCDFVCKKKWTI